MPRPPDCGHVGPCIQRSSYCYNSGGISVWGGGGGVPNSMSNFRKNMGLDP